MVHASVTTEPRGRVLLSARFLLSAAVMGACLALTLAILLVLAWAVGVSPWMVLTTLLDGAAGSSVAAAATAAEAVPIALTALAFYIPYRTGFFNIGAQGQLEIGALAAMFVVSVVAAPPALTLPLALLAAMAAGALLIVPSVLLKSWRGASEVTTTIMLNLVAVEFVMAMVSGPMRDVDAFYSTTVQVPEALRLPGGSLHAGIWLTLAIVVIAHWALKRTVFGFRLDAVGGNPLAAAVAGMPVRRVYFQAVLIGAAIGGLAGGIQVLGVLHQVAEGWSKPWGFTGILAALLGGSPGGILVGSLLLAGLETGGRNMQAMTGVPAAMVYVLQGLPVLFFLALRAMPLVRFHLDRKEGL